MAPLEWPRMLLAIGLAVLLGGGSTAIVGYASATDRPDTLEIPPLLPGDEGRYESPDADPFAFQVALEPFLWADGTVRDTLVVRTIQNPDDGPRIDTSWYAPNGTLLASRAFEDSRGAGAGNSIGLGPTDVILQAGSFWQSYRTVRDNPVPTGCGLVHDGQGTTLHLSQSVEVHTPCGTMVVFDNATAVLDQTTLQLTTHVPVPAAVARDGVWWHLTAFSRGSPPASEGRMEAAAMVRHAPFVRGPDTGGLPRPHPLSDAISWALDVEPTNDLRAFFDGHPDAYLAGAEFVELVEDGTRRHQWTVVASDGQEAVAVALTYDAAQADTTPPIVPVGTGLVLPAVPVPRIVSLAEPPGPYPAPGAVPATLPVLADMIPAWQQSASATARLAGINAYGFDVRCADDCSTAHAVAWIGHNRIRVDEIAGEIWVCALACANSGGTWMADRLGMTHDGRIADRLDTEYQHYQTAHITQSPVHLGEDDRHQAQGPGIVEGSAVWAFPGSPEVAAASMLGLLASALYYFWPQLKAGLLAPLMSQEKLLGHPTRGQLLDVIRSQPGVHYHALLRATDQASGALRHHLSLLEKGGHIQAKRTAGYLCYFPSKGIDRHIMAAMGAVKSDAARRLLQTAVRQPGITMAEAAARVGLSPSSATHHAKRLEDAGLVSRQRNGRVVALLATPLAASALRVA